MLGELHISIQIGSKWLFQIVPKSNRQDNMEYLTAAHGLSIW